MVAAVCSNYCTGQEQGAEFISEVPEQEFITISWNLVFSLGKNWGWNLLAGKKSAVRSWGRAFFQEN